MREILVGVDGSPPAEAALSWAANVAVATGTELVAATAWTPGQAEVDPTLAKRLKAETSEQLAGEWCEPARSIGATVRPLFLEGHAADALLAAAVAERPSVLVVGTRGAGGFPGLQLGSVAHHLSHHTTGPLAIVPAPFATRGVRRIVLGVDGSPGSLAAVAWCAGLAQAAGATVTAVLAFEPLLEWVLESDPKSWRRQAEREMAAWNAPLSAAGVAVTTEIVEDIHPVAGIAQVAGQEDADLIVVGTHGLRGFVGMRLGGVALQLLHQLQRPVALVPPAAS